MAAVTQPPQQRTTMDITSEQHAKKRGPSHNTEQPQMTRRVTETLADTSKRLLPEPYDDGHVPSHQLNQPHHTLLDDAATIAKQVYTRPPTTTTKGKQPRKPKSTPTTPTALKVQRTGWSSLAPECRVKRGTNNSIVHMVLRALSRKQLIETFSTHNTKEQNSKPLPTPPPIRSPRPPTSSATKTPHHECKGCARLYTTKKRLVSHLADYPEHEQPSPPVPHSCKGCCARFTNNWDLNQHHQEHPAHLSASIVDQHQVPFWTIREKRTVNREMPDYKQVRTKSTQDNEQHEGGARKYRATTPAEQHMDILAARDKHRHKLVQLAKQHFPDLQPPDPLDPPDTEYTRQRHLPTLEDQRKEHTRIVCDGTYRDFETTLTTTYLAMVANGRLKAAMAQHDQNRVILALHGRRGAALDSGAGIHCVNDPTLISNHRPAPFDSVEGFNGSSAPVRAFGDVGQLTGVVATDTVQDLVSTGLLLAGTNYAIIHDDTHAYMASGICITRRRGRPPDITVTNDPRVVEIATRDSDSGLYIMHPLLSSNETAPETDNILDYLQQTHDHANGTTPNNANTDTHDPDWSSPIYCANGTSTRTNVPVNTTTHNQICRHCNYVANHERNNDTVTGWSCNNTLLPQQPLRKPPKRPAAP